MATENYANSPVTQLNGAINSSVTTLIVDAITGFPGSTDFHVKIDQEILLVTSMAGTTWTVVRGVDGTTAASHVDDSFVRHPLTVEALERLLITRLNNTVIKDRRQLNFKDSVGITWTIADDPTNKWVDITPNITGQTDVYVEPPAVASLTWVNQGSADASDQSPGFRLSDDSNVAVTSRMLVRSHSGGHTLRVKVLPLMYDDPDCFVGICVRDSSSGKVVRFGFQDNKVKVQSMSSSTVVDTTIATDTISPLTLPYWLMIQDNSGNITYAWGVDSSGVTEPSYSAIRTDYLAVPDQIGAYIDPKSAVAKTTAAKFVSWDYFVF